MYRIIDLFSGAGGLTFGFEYKVIDDRFVKRDEFKSEFAVDFSESATIAFRKNFPNIPTFNLDIKDLDKKTIEGKIGKNEIDLIVGGPPCQSFSMIGKRINDDRAKLYIEYRRILKIIQPKMFVFENVKGMLTMKDEEKNYILDKVVEDFEETGYTVTWKVLNAASFGVPQLRERVFIIGVRNDIEGEYNFPKIQLEEKDFLTLRDAISDFPTLDNGESKDTYSTPPANTYQRLMRNNIEKITNHTNGRKTDLMLEIFNALDEGESKVDINRKVENGELPKRLLRKSGYNNTYGRLWWDRPGMTITNKINCPSSLRCIHPSQNRALTPREGARIQSFPDWFNFSGSMSDVMTQIGNAVPPLLSIAVANSILDFLDRRK